MFLSLFVYTLSMYLFTYILHIAFLHQFIKVNEICSSGQEVKQRTDYFHVNCIICTLGRPCFSSQPPSSRAPTPLLLALYCPNSTKRRDLLGGTQSTCPLSPWTPRAESHLWAARPSGSPWTSRSSRCPGLTRRATAIMTGTLQARVRMEVMRKTYLYKYSVWPLWPLLQQLLARIVQQKSSKL